MFCYDKQGICMLSPMGRHDSHTTRQMNLLDVSLLVSIRIDSEKEKTCEHGGLTYDCSRDA